MASHKQKSATNADTKDKFPLKDDPDGRIYRGKDEVKKEIYDTTSPRNMTADVLGFDFIQVLREEKHATGCAVNIGEVIRTELLSSKALATAAKREAGNVKRENFLGYNDISDFEINQGLF